MTLTAAGMLAKLSMWGFVVMVSFACIGGGAAIFGAYQTASTAAGISVVGCLLFLAGSLTSVRRPQDGGEGA